LGPRAAAREGRLRSGGICESLSRPVNPAEVRCRLAGEALPAEGLRDRKPRGRH
jgi:hypothetical protein